VSFIRIKNQTPTPPKKNENKTKQKKQERIFDWPPKLPRPKEFSKSKDKCKRRRNGGFCS
jgi:hypothetical protein